MYFTREIVKLAFTGIRKFPPVTLLTFIRKLSLTVVGKSSHYVPHPPKKQSAKNKKHLAFSRSNESGWPKIGINLC